MESPFRKSLALAGQQLPTPVVLTAYEIMSPKPICMVHLAQLYQSYWGSMREDWILNHSPKFLSLPYSTACSSLSWYWEQFFITYFHVFVLWNWRIHTKQRKHFRILLFFMFGQELSLMLTMGFSIFHTNQRQSRAERSITFSCLHIKHLTKMLQN